MNERGKEENIDRAANCEAVRMQKKRSGVVREMEGGRGDWGE